MANRPGTINLKRKASSSGSGSAFEAAAVGGPRSGGSKRPRKPSARVEAARRRTERAGRRSPRGAGARRRASPSLGKLSLARVAPGRIPSSNAFERLLERQRLPAPRPGRTPHRSARRAVSEPAARLAGHLARLEELHHLVEAADDVLVPLGAAMAACVLATFVLPGREVRGARNVGSPTGTEPQGQYPELQSEN